MTVYVDTSALVKRYVEEGGSQTFDDFLVRSNEDFVITPLGIAEMESVLQRRLRQGDFDLSYLDRTRALFGEDLANALWQVRPFDPRAFQESVVLMRELDAPLATLDALHLASALIHGCEQLATSDKQLARAAQLRGLVIHDFSS